MSELKKHIIEIIRTPQLFCLATITLDGKPWVRYVFCEGRQDMTIRFATFVSSRKVAQIRKNPEVHLTCGVSSPADMKPYLQIQGRAELLTDTVERKEFWKESLKNYFHGPDDANYGVVVVKPYLVELCSPGSLAPQIWHDGIDK